MKFNAEIWYLFKLNRDEFNRFDRKTLKVLTDVFERGKREGKKEQAKLTELAIKKLK